MRPADRCSAMTIPTPSLEGRCAAAVKLIISSLRFHPGGLERGLQLGGSLFLPIRCAGQRDPFSELFVLQRAAQDAVNDFISRCWVRVKAHARHYEIIV